MKINVSNWDLESAFAFFEEQGGECITQDGAGRVWLSFNPRSA
jgi:hypothetical protein